MRRVLLVSIAMSFSLLFFSCSYSPRTSSVSFSVSKNIFRSITDLKSKNYSLKISLSGDYEDEKSFELKSEDDLKNPFRIEDLPVGKKVSVNVEVFCDDFRYYKTKGELQSLFLNAGENVVDITLEKAFGDASIELEKSSAILISAKDSDGKDYSYDENGTKIPYDNKITFTVNLDEDISFDSYFWFINGEKIDGSDSEILFNPKENDFVQFGTNSLTCFLKNGETTDISEFKFIITADAE